MDDKKDVARGAARVLASLSDVDMMKLADLVAARLAGQNSPVSFPSEESRVRISPPAPHA